MDRGDQVPFLKPEIILILCEALAVACKDADIRDVKALIIGPPNTPYEFGFFEVLSSNF